MYGQDNFKKIERDLRDIEQTTIENILSYFTKIPNNECIATLQKINTLRGMARAFFLGTCDKNQIYYFQPNVVHAFKDYKDMLNALWKDEEISLETLSSYAKQCMQSRGIDECLIDCAIPSEEILSNTVFLGSTEDVLKTVAFVRNINFSKENFVNPAIFFNVNRLQQHKVFPIIEHTIHHEITHLIEAHTNITTVLMDVVAKYYPEENLDKHDLFCKLVYAHELIADVVPAMVSVPILFLRKYQDLAERLRIISNTPTTNNHPSLSELRIWHERILNCYENDYVQLNYYNKLSFALSIPIIRSTLIKYSSALFGGTVVGCGISKILENKS